MRYTKSDIDDYMNILTPEQEDILVAHSNEHQVAPVICAWYDDIDDFHEAWEEVTYTEEQADELLENEKTEFITFEDEQIIRLVI